MIDAREHRRVADRTLIIEDDETVAWGLLTLLSALGMRARIASTATDALAVVDSYLPDLVMLDVGLPDADGRTIAPLFSAAGTAVLLMSGHAFATTGEATAFLRKPFTLDELRAAMHSLGFEA